MTRIEFTELERRIDEGLFQLSFRHGGFSEGPISREEYKHRQREELPELDAFLDLAFDGKAWRVGPSTAAHVATHRWFSAMTLREYERAQAEIERCMLHPGPFDRKERSEFPILLNLPRLFTGEAADAAQALAAHIESGIYRRGEIASLIGLTLCGSLEEHSDEPVTPPVRELAKTISHARKSPKRLLLACESAGTMADLIPVLNEVCFPSRIP